MKITLERFGYTPHGTFGRLYIPEVKQEIFTCEEVWNPKAKREEGLANSSCIPEGAYKLSPTDRPKHKNTYVLINEALNVYEFHNTKTDWSSILIHVGNTIDDVDGCIAPGLKFGIYPDRQKTAVLESRKAYEIIRNVLGDTEDHEIEIIRFDPDKYSAV